MAMNNKKMVQKFKFTLLKSKKLLDRKTKEKEVADFVNTNVYFLKKQQLINTEVNCKASLFVINKTLLKSLFLSNAKTITITTKKEKGSKSLVWLINLDLTKFGFYLEKLAVRTKNYDLVF